ncbi:HesA/MoeB/ThiF family protein [Sphingomonas sp. RB1R13]|uniref:HesA/MoeB/ThiF family protein n=1 Tax=Sphingomonas sp. RB1R13 TaxID=3096159 RepID=UPI002FC7AEF9
MTLTDEELDRYARHIVLPQVGGAGQQRLKAARVAVVGAGGIGSALIPALAGAGVGRLTIIDGDTVDLSNLQRQPLYRSDQIGRGKAVLAGQFVNALNPFVETIPIACRIDAANAADFLAGHDLIIDGTDNFATRLIVSDTAVALGIPLVSAAAAQFQGQVGLFRGKPCYRCFVGDAFDADDCDTCAEQGVMGAMVGTVGQFAALVAIRAIVGIEPDAAGKLYLFDGAGLEWRTMRLPPDPDCRICNG